MRATSTRVRERPKIILQDFWEVLGNTANVFEDDDDVVG